MLLLRRLIGDVLRRHRVLQSRTLRDVSAAAGVSLGYLSEVERGRKEASSELLAAICRALEVSLSDVLREVSDDLARDERRERLAPLGFTIPAPDAARSAAGRAVAGIAPLGAGRLADPPALRPVAVRPPAPAGSRSVTSALGTPAVAA